MPPTPQPVPPVTSFPPLPGKVRVLVCRFPYGNSEHPAVGAWLVATTKALARHPRVGDVGLISIADTPITMTRNLALAKAKAGRFDFAVFVDSDMVPDVEVGVAPTAKPFLPSALDFALAHDGPCCVAAPYCGPPPDCSVYIFHWTQLHPHRRPVHRMRMAMIDRDDASRRGGFEHVAALPTGLMLIDLRGLDALPANQPYFAYEYTDCHETQKATTEDVFFTRNLNLVGVNQYVAWDSWAGHYKPDVIGRPVPIGPDWARQELAEAITRGFPRHGERLVFDDGVAVDDDAAMAQLRGDIAALNGVS